MDLAEYKFASIDQQRWLTLWISGHEIKVTIRPWLQVGSSQTITVSLYPETAEEFARKLVAYAQHARMVKDNVAKNSFMPCDSCRSKPGSPLLCKSCQHNQSLIDALKTNL